MPLNLFQTRLARELPLINAALDEAADNLPSPCRPIARHILHAGGKRMRPFLSVLCARMFGYPQNDIYKLAASMELLHAATLLHDDILDNAASRRGNTAAHIIFGEAAVILAGDAMLAQGNAIVASFANPELVLRYSTATIQTAAGEILEMNSLYKPDISPSQYLEIAKNKTACLISQSCLLGANIACATPENASNCEKFGENLGIAFQIVDDALDFAPEKQTGKPRGGDLREGKMTPPLRLYRDSLNSQDRAIFDQKFSKGDFGSEEIEKVILEVGNFAEQAADLSNVYLDVAKKALDNLPMGDENLILRQMADFVRSRRN